MDFQNIKWNKQTYQKFIKHLKTISEKDYQKFHQKLLKNEKIKVLGIRTPKLKEIARQISKTDYLKFIKYNTHTYYEENIIHGLLLGFIKDDNILNLIDDFIPYIDNWATCDVTCANLKIFKKLNINQTKKYLQSSNPWEIRFGLVILLDHYIEKENLSYIFITCNTVKNDHYYVKMAIAWLLSICYIKYPEITLKYLKSGDLDNFTYNKTISKICESLRVSKETKEKLKKLKRK